MNVNGKLASGLASGGRQPPDVAVAAISRATSSGGLRPPLAKALFGYAQDRPYPMVTTALQALQRDGIMLRELGKDGDGTPDRWIRAVAECVKSGECQGGVVFCEDPGLACCVANKVSGLRAATVLTVMQAARATLTLGANLLLVEMPGRTFFEIRQIIKTLCDATNGCPDGVACTLQELDGHAHR